MQDPIYRRNAIISVVVTFVVLTGMILGYGFGIHRKRQKTIDDTIAAYNTRKTDAAKLGPAQIALAKATQDQQLLDAQLAFFRSRYRSLKLDLRKPSDLDQTFRRWQNEYYYQYGPALKSELRGAEATVRNTSPFFRITSAIGPVVSSPPKNPEEVQPSIPANGLLKPTADIDMTIQGDLPSILRFFETITSDQSSLLKVISNVRLEGASPRIKASFRVTPYLIARGPAVSLGGAAPAAAAPVAAPTGAPPPT